MRKIEVIPYNPEWKELYKKEETILKQIFEPILVTIEHIGSTSVPGLAAKPVIDILAEVTHISLADSYNSLMTKAGYEAKGEYGIDGRRFFIKGGDNRSHHLHMFCKDDPHVLRHQAFRDYLIERPQIAEAYAELKEILAARFPFDSNRYCAEKDGFIKEVEKQALRWYKKR